jgi:iron complex transport system substrate-binding protein
VNKNIGVTVFAALVTFWPSPSSAAGVTSTAATSLVVTDAIGRQVNLPNPPLRILLAGKAVLSTTNTAFLFPEARNVIIGTGATDQGMGDMYPLLDPTSDTKMRFANNVGPEQLISARPDVVVLKSYLREGLGSSLEKIGLPVLYVDLETPESFYRDVTMFGTLMGNSQRADEIIGYYQERSELVGSRVEGRVRPRVLLVSYTETDGLLAFNVPPAGWLQTMMVEQAGGEPVWRKDHGGNGWQKIGLEQIAAWDPDLVLVVSYRVPVSTALPRLQSIMSLGMIDVRILPFPADFYSWDQPDPRWILGLLWTARIINPGLFEDIDMDKEVREFFSAMYGIDSGTIETHILPRLESALSITR